MKAFSLKGMWTALVTPFLPEGAIDWLSLDQLIDYQLDSGVTGLMVWGTTSEVSTLSDPEQEELLLHVMERVKGRVPILAGVGTNDTKTTLAKARKAVDRGVQGLMVVAPYYNRPPQRGLLNHFGSVAEAFEMPIVLYNVPSRCGVEISVETVKELHAAYPHIQAIKDCGNSVDRFFQLAHEVGPDFEALTGDDNWILSAIALGGKGVISAVSNVLPKDCVALVQSLLRNDMALGLEIFKRIYPVIQKAFIETNPIAIKYLLFKMGIITADTVRAPLTSLNPAFRDEVERTLRQYQFLA